MEKHLDARDIRHRIRIKFIAITYKKPGTAGLLKDYEHDYRIPEIPKFETGHIRSTQKTLDRAHNQQYFIRGSIQEFRENMEVLNAYKQKFYNGSQHKDQILTVYWSKLLMMRCNDGNY